MLRLRGRLDHLIGELVEGGLGRLEPPVLDILRLGAYQLLELDRVPAYAAVSEAVEAARASGHARATGLVNAVLRRLERDERPQRFFPRPDEDPAGYLSTWGSHPRWLVDRWLERWPLTDVQALVEYGNRRPVTYLSVGVPAEKAKERLGASGGAAVPVHTVPGSIGLASGRVGEALRAVPSVVQDPAALSVVEYVAAEPGRPVIDMCAAPGGKAAVLAMRGFDVRAFDVSRLRLARVIENRERLGLENLTVAVADARKPPVRSAATVLLDVPCTGTGTLARNPDSRWRLTPAGLGALVEVQEAMLDAAAGLVAPGGLLVYATCSLELEENEGQVAAFLERHPGFAVESPPSGTVSDELLGEGGELRITPQRHGMDGAYAARLRRRSD